MSNIWFIMYNFGLSNIHSFETNIGLIRIFCLIFSTAHKLTKLTCKLHQLCHKPFGFLVNYTNPTKLFFLDTYTYSHRYFWSKLRLYITTHWIMMFLDTLEVCQNYYYQELFIVT